MESGSENGNKKSNDSPVWEILAFYVPANQEHIQIS